MKALQNYIYRLRQEPESKRRRHALAWSVGLTGIVFVLWLVSLQYTLSNSSEPVIVNEVGESGISQVVTRMGRGWEVLQASVINSWQD